MVSVSGEAVGLVGTADEEGKIGADKTSVGIGGIEVDDVRRLEQPAVKEITINIPESKKILCIL